MRTQPRDAADRGHGRHVHRCPGGDAARGGLARLRSASRTLLYAPVPRGGAVARLPICLRVLLENLTRQALLGADVSAQIDALVDRLSGARLGIRATRVLLDDVAGVPVLVDLASLRDAVAAAGGNASGVNPRVPFDLLIGACPAAEGANLAQRERAAFLAWCRRSFDNLRVLPSGARDAHGLDLECLCETQWARSAAGSVLVHPGLMVGTHAGMAAANALGIFGWAVSGLEATAILTGRPLSLAVPEVVGVELSGNPHAAAESGELALAVIEALRRHRIAGRIVEFFGRGVETLSIPTRAALASLAPEAGAASLYFPMDRRALDYMRSVGGGEERIRLAERYAKIQGLWLDKAARPLDYDVVSRLELGEIGRSILRLRRRTGGSELRAPFVTRPRLGRGGLCEQAAARPRRDGGAALARASRFRWPPPGSGISRAPFFDGLSLAAQPLVDIVGARALVIVGNAVSGQHISPCGPMACGSAAQEYLRAGGASLRGLETYEMRRGDYEAAVRATFASTRLRNRLARGAKGDVTMLMPDGVRTRVFDAASEYQRRGVPVVVIAGRRYGFGSAHDWASKGVASLGVRAVIAESFERIHRASLIGAGVLPLILPERWKLATSALEGSETFDLVELDWSVGVRTQVQCIIRAISGAATPLLLQTAIETVDELDYLRNGGILPALWRERLRGSRSFSA